MYGKLFASMYEGSLYGQWQALVTFQQMIVLADCEGRVDMTPQALAARTSIPFEIIEKGIALLEAPDSYSRSADHDGRRIVRVDAARPWGWEIVNYKYYRNLATAEDKRRADRERIAAKRAVSQPVAECRDLSRDVANVAHAEVEAEVEVEAEGSKKPTAHSAPPEFAAIKAIYPKRAGDQGWPKALRAINARLNEGITWDELTDGARRYAEYVRVTGSENTPYVKQAATFFGPDGHYRLPWTSPPNKAERLADANVTAAQEWLRNSP